MEKLERLKIGKGRSGFTLPLELVTSTQAILARKRSGKSYTASVQAEELLEHRQQVIVFDPTSAWYGLRSSADGNATGFPIVVFGGDHADAPLDFRSGRSMAAAVVEHGFSAIFDIGSLHTEEQVQFVMDFSSEMLRINRTAVHVFMDEADTFAPQKPLGLLQNKCLGTVSRLVKQGGIRGIGFTMITQRPASMNKDVLSQVDILTVLRMSHPLDIKAATDWIKSEVSVEFARDVERDLPSLPVGTAYFCSASLHLGERVEVRARKTFNSGATPKPGERRLEPSVMVDIDIVSLGEKIAASVKVAQEHSVEYLQEKIRTLEAQPKSTDDTERVMGLIEEIAELHRERDEFKAAADQVPNLEARLEQYAERENVFLGRIQSIVAELTTILHETGTGAYVQDVQAASASTTLRLPPKPEGAVSRAFHITAHGEPPRADTEIYPAIAADINAPQQRILNAIATLHASRAGSVSIEWIAATAGTTPRARGFEENLRQLRNNGYVEGIRLTETGAAIATASATIPTFEAMLSRLSVMLSHPQINILRQLKTGRHTPEALADAMGTTVRARGFEENVRQLRRREYVRFHGGNYGLVPWLESLR